MARIQWDEIGERLYETGISNCVLYVRKPDHVIERNYFSIPDQDFSGIGPNGFIPSTPFNSPTGTTSYPLIDQLTVPFGEPLTFSANLITSEDSTARISLSYKITDSINHVIKNTGIQGDLVEGSGVSSFKITIPEEAEDIKFVIVRNGLTTGSVSARSIKISGVTTGNFEIGVPWNGLTSVNESPEGAETTDVFADDIKYLVLRSPENFKATIEAYTYPEEFLPCEGIAIPIPGVYLDQQPYRTFSICYKTRMGNDVDGDDHGYKLHIIYNCLASPSEKDYGTIDDDPDAIVFSWELDSVPMLVDGFKPTSTITIDSTKIDPIDLEIIENKLYGTANSLPTLLTPHDIQVILQSSFLITEDTDYILIGGDRIIV